MNLQEYNIVKDFNYKTYYEYLNKKYGEVPAEYGKAYNKRPDEGLFIHHIKEDEQPGLSSVEARKLLDPDYQQPHNLVYCNYLEHWLLHILIGEKICKTALRDTGLDGPARYIVPALRKFYNDGFINEKINEGYYRVIEGNKDVFDLMLNRWNNLVTTVDFLFSHNEVAYKQIEHFLDTDKKALFILDTGLGKTTTALQYIMSHLCATLVLGPNNVVLSSWDYPLCRTMCYQSFVNEMNANPNFIDRYELIVLDEAHHVGYEEETDMGAAKWGPAIKKALAHTKVKVLGLTATPERGDGIDVRKLFGSNVVKGKTIEEAVKENIVYPFSYITAIYDLPKATVEFREAYEFEDADATTKNLLGQLDTLANKFSLEDVFHRVKSGGKVRGIVFVQSKRGDKDPIANAKVAIENAYPNAKIRVLYSDTEYLQANDPNHADNEKNKKWFDGTEDSEFDKFIITINMAGEGWHPKFINELIMFRKTNSYSVYTQQLGRIVTLIKNGSVDPHAVVFDLVNNIENIGYSRRRKNGKSKNKKSKAEKIIEALIEKQNELPSTQIIVDIDDISKQYLDIAEEIKARFLDVTWDDWEIEIIRTYYAAEGPEGCQRRIDEEWERRHPGSLTA